MPAGLTARTWKAYSRSLTRLVTVWAVVVALLPEMFVQPAPVEGVATASPRMLPTILSLASTARTWKVYSVPLVRFPRMRDVVEAPLPEMSVHETLVQLPAVLLRYCQLSMLDVSEGLAQERATAPSSGKAVRPPPGFCLPILPAGDGRIAGVAPGEGDLAEAGGCGEAGGRGGRGGGLGLGGGAGVVLVVDGADLEGVDGAAGEAGGYGVGAQGPGQVRPRSPRPASGAVADLELGDEALVGLRPCPRQS